MKSVESRDEGLGGALAFPSMLQGCIHTKPGQEGVVVLGEDKV